MAKSFFRTHLLWGILAVSFVFVIIVGVLVYSHVNQLIFTGYTEALKAETNSFELALQHSLMTQDNSMMMNIIQDLSSQSAVHTIRVLNSEGEVIASSIFDEVGVVLDPQGRNCNTCHSVQSDMLPLWATIPSDDENSPQLVIANSLNNRVVCQSCHSQEQETLGVILAEYHGSAPKALQQNLAMIVTASGVGIWAGMVLLFLWVYRTHFNRPIRQLLSGENDDELIYQEGQIGDVVRKMSAMRKELEENKRLASNQRAHFRALMSISSTIEDSVTIESVFRRALTTLQEVTGYTSIAMRYYDQEAKAFILVHQYGLSPKMIKELASIPDDKGYHAELIHTRRAVRSTDLANDPRIQSRAPLEVGFYSMASIPFLSGERIMGSMDLASRDPQTYPDEQIRWLELVGRVIGNILHHIELAERLQGVAIMKERNYIAQEIHDGLVQLLGSLRIWAEGALLAVDAQKYDEVEEIVKKIEANAREAYSNLREEILGLRDTFLPEEGIIPVVREYLRRYQRQWEIETQLQVDQVVDDAQERFTTPNVEIQLLRIIQEALTNVRRHSHATIVKVIFSHSEQYSCVEIIDNGTGFNPENVSEEKLGLRIMRERVMSIDGTLTISTTQLEGTRLSIKVPAAKSPIS